MNDFSKHPLYGAHTIDTAMNSLWSFYKNNFVMLFLMSLVMASILQYAMMSLVDIQALQVETDINVLMEKFSEQMGGLGIIVLANFLFTVIIQTYIMFSPLDEDVSMVDLTIKALRYSIPYVIILIFFSAFAGIAIVLGLFAFVIGAIFAVIYVIMLYLFILPVMMAEKADIGYTIGRVAGMAHKKFWSNYAFVAVFIGLFLIISFMASILILAPFTGDFLASIFNPDGAANVADITQKPLYIVLSVIVNAIMLPFIPILSALIYFSAKAREENQTHDYIRIEETRVTVEDLYAKPYSDNHPDNPENKPEA